MSVFNVRLHSSYVFASRLPWTPRDPRVKPEVLGEGAHAGQLTEGGSLCQKQTNANTILSSCTRSTMDFLGVFLKYFCSINLDLCQHEYVFSICIFSIATWRSWKRAGLITPRSLDRNELLLYRELSTHFILQILLRH